MPFYTACKKLAESLPAGDVNRAILDYLLAQGVGIENIQSWPKIEAHLQASCPPQEKIPSKESFQTGLLKRTREGEEFIGSTTDGYFIINCRRDAEETERFYTDRIKSQTQRLAHLGTLMDQDYPKN